jgi:O-antigen ligase
MYWFILLYPFLIYPWGTDPYYTVPKFVYLISFVTVYWTILVVIRRKWFMHIHKTYTPVEGILSVFIGLMVLSTIFSVNQTTSIYGTDFRYEGLITLFSYCSLLIFAYRLVNPLSIEKIIKGMVTVSLVVSLYGIMQHYLIDFLPRNSTKIGYKSSFAFFDNPNFFGSYLVMLIMLSIYLYSNEIKRSWSIFYFFCTSISFVAMIFSNTRSAFVGFAFGILFFIIFVVLRRKILWKRWVLLLLTLTSLFVIIDRVENGGVSNRAKTIIEEPTNIVTEGSTGHEGSNRYFIWKKSVPLIADYFLLGSGPDTLKYVFPADEKEKVEFFNDPNMIIDKAHNEYIQIAVTLGVPALLTYLLLISFIFYNAIRAIKVSKPKDNLVIFGLLSAIMGYLVQAFFNISVVPVAPLFWILLGFTYALSMVFLNQNNRVVHSKEKAHEQLSIVG